MRYESTALPDAMSVDGIYTVLKVNYSKRNVGIGESHDFPEISFISRGTHWGILDGQERKKTAGQMTIIAPGSFHKSKRPSDSEGLIISFSSSSPALRDLYNRTLNLTAEQERTYRSIVADGLECFCRREPDSEIAGMILKNGVEAHKIYRLKKRLELFLIDIHRYFSSPNFDSKRDRDFERAIRFMSENLDKSLTLDAIAKGASMSVSKLKLLFKEKSGGGAINHFIEMKIERAKTLIKENKMNFTEIAYTLGFTSLHYFSRLFKKVTTISPTDYANQAKIN